MNFDNYRNFFYIQPSTRESFPPTFGVHNQEIVDAAIRDAEAVRKAFRLTATPMKSLCRLEARLMQGVTAAVRDVRTPIK